LGKTLKKEKEKKKVSLIEEKRGKKCDVSPAKLKMSKQKR
jgi:hypothetical protein